MANISTDHRPAACSHTQSSCSKFPEALSNMLGDMADISERERDCKGQCSVGASDQG